MKYLPHYFGHAEWDIPEAFGYRYTFRCATCGPIQEIRSIETIRPSWDDPGDGYDYCPNCGSLDVAENDTFKPFRMIRRRRIHSNHSMRIAA